MTHSAQAKPTPAQDRVIRQFAGDIHSHDGRRAPTQATYKVCERNGWIEQTDTWPYHRTTTTGAAIVGITQAAPAPRTATQIETDGARPDAAAQQAQLEAWGSAHDLSWSASGAAAAAIAADEAAAHAEAATRIEPARPVEPTGPRGDVAVGKRSNGTSNRWTRTIRGSQYAFNLVISTGGQWSAYIFKADPLSAGTRNEWPLIREIHPTPFAPVRSPVDPRPGGPAETQPVAADPAARRKAFFARTSDQALIAALRIIEAAHGTRTPEETMVRAWTMDEIEQRWPAASDAVEAAFDAAAPDEDVDYAAVLLGAIPAGVPGIRA